MCVHNLTKLISVRCLGGNSVETNLTSGIITIPLEVVGSALYPTLPLLNHSCIPNTIR